MGCTAAKHERDETLCSGKHTKWEGKTQESIVNDDSEFQKGTP